MSVVVHFDWAMHCCAVWANYTQVG